jgi:hypothetical protein
MIDLTTPTSSGYITHSVNPAAIARITEAATSSQWHGIRSYVKLFDGQTLEVSEPLEQIKKAIKESMI